MSAPVARLDGVCKIYQAKGDPVVALDDVNLSIAVRDYVAVMGPSGSGKSTMLNLLGGIDRPTRGAITVCGERIDNLPERKLLSLRRHRVAFVFQEARLMLSLTAIENVMLPSAFSRSGTGTEVGTRAQALLDRVGLGGRAHHMVNQLSGGEAQRVCIARALMTRPALILADEPTGNLDGATGRAVIDLIFSLHDRAGTTLVLITHDPALAARCDRVVRLEDGRVSAPAPAPEPIRQP